MVLVALPTRNAMTPLPHEARRVVHHLVGDLLPKQRFPGVGKDPHSGHLGHGPPLATPTSSALVALAAVVLVFETVLDARGGAPPRLLLVADVLVTLPLCGVIRHPCLHSSGRRPLGSLAAMRRRRRRRGPPLVAHHRRSGWRGPPLVPHCRCLRGRGQPLRPRPRLTRRARRRWCRYRPIPGQPRDPEVADHRRAGLGPLASFAAAHRPVHPSHVLRFIAPIGDPQAHALTHRCRQGGNIALVALLMSKDDLPILLPEDGAHAEKHAVLVGKLSLQAERLPGVDGVPAPRAVGAMLVIGALSATAAVAIGVISVLRRIAFVQCCLQHPAVGFHDVYLRAPLTADLVRVTVVLRLAATVLARAEAARPIAGGH
mmetsp:Transcript_81097/g.235266  ORF Transcript_81097/g.235266 Transcript_81097/m.235266 type:complete len:373 (-) Transcript_81097:496-1614(-)